MVVHNRRSPELGMNIDKSGGAGPPRTPHLCSYLEGT